MPRIAHTRRRDGRYVWRRRIPLDLVDIIGRSEFVFSLRTGSGVTAPMRARRLDVIADRLFHMLRQGTDLTRQQIHDLARRWFAEALEEEEAAIARRRYDDEDEVARALARARTLREGAQDLLRHNDLGPARAYADALLSDAGVQLSRQDPLYRELCRLILRATAEVTRHGVAWREGDYAVAPSDPFFAVGAADGHKAVAPTMAKPTPAALPFSHFIDIDISERVSNGKVQRQTQAQLKTRMTLFTRLVGDKPVTEYRRADILQYRDALARVPSSYGKSPKDHTRTVAEIFAREGERLSQETQTKHFEAVAACFHTAARHYPEYGLHLASLLEKIEVDGRPSAKREVWGMDAISKLFATPVWQGRVGTTVSASCKPGPAIIRDALFWLPLIALYTGMRLEEIAKLRAGDLREVDGMVAIDVNEQIGRLKNKNSVRLIPVHPELLRVGLLEFAAQFDPQQRLFPELKPAGKNGKLGHDFSRDFSRYRIQTGVYQRYQDFHSFRHTFASALYDQCNDLLLVARVCGHDPREMADLANEKGLSTRELSLETVRYIHGNLQGMHDAVTSLVYPQLDLSHLHVDRIAAAAE